MKTMMAMDKFENGSGGERLCASKAVFEFHGDRMFFLDTPGLLDHHPMVFPDALCSTSV